VANSYEHKYITKSVISQQTSKSQSEAEHLRGRSKMSGVACDTNVIVFHSACENKRSLNFVDKIKYTR